MRLEKTVRETAVGIRPQHPSAYLGTMADDDECFYFLQLQKEAVRGWKKLRPLTASQPYFSYVCGEPHFYTQRTRNTPNLQVGPDGKRGEPVPVGEPIKLPSAAMGVRS